MIIILGILFACIGLVSAIVGLGGGTLYLLVMQLWGVPILLVPVISLMCNITVSGLGAVLRLIKHERVSLSFMLLLLLPSMLTSYLGGSIRIQEDKFRLLLNVSLLVIIMTRAGLQLLIDRNAHKDASLIQMSRIKLCVMSAVIGFVSGLIGIGGGIILGPLLYIYGFSYARIPLITAIYIFANSFMGISAKLSGIGHLSDLQSYLILPIISVLVVFIAMKCITYRVNSKQVRNIAFLTILLITVYNIIKGGMLYVF